MKPNVRCTNASQVSSGADREGGVDEELRKNMISALLPLFSAMWQTNLLPTVLGDATRRYIPKGTKPPQGISGYTPIFLTSCIGKLYTMLWLPKLTNKLAPWIGRDQGAF